MGILNEEFNELVRPSAKTPGFTLGNLDEWLREHLYSTDFKEPEEEEESMDMFWVKLMGCLKQMMYVSGETAEPSQETTGMVEEIVRQQVIEMVCDTGSISLDLCPGELQRSSRPGMHETFVLLPRSLQENLC
jgi:hypothetical protein